MSSKTVRKSLLTGASLFAAAAVTLAATPAVAQDDTAAVEDEEIVVTGSRIARPGFTSTSPIATIGGAELALQQPLNVEELLRNQPQFGAGDGTQTNNGSRGAATLNLRGLSPTRTLPLIDGKRIVGFDPSGLFDTSAVPLALLERIDVVTGGASAVYGSDAIAGVVNFVLNDDFRGVEGRWEHTLNDLHDTGDADSASLTIGSSFDDGRGNVALSVGWLDREAVYQVEGPAALAPGASSTTVPAAVDSAVGGRTQFNNAGSLVPFFQAFDFNGQNLYQAPQQRWNATAIGRYEISDALEAYSRFIYNSSTSAPQLASSGTFGLTFAVPLNSPFLSVQAANYLAANNTVSDCAVLSTTNVAINAYGVSAPAGVNCVPVGLRWRGVAVGPRQYQFEYDTFQTLVGLRGDIGESGWEWDVAYAYGETSLKRQQNNDIDATRVQQALFATGPATCFDPSNLCAPLNIFNGSTSPSDAALDFIRLNLQVQSLTTQEYVIGSVSGDTGEIHSPFASSPIGASFGIEWRRESSDYRPDAASQAGISPGFGQTLPVAGSFDVFEAFGEALVPIVEDAPFADSINLELGFRTSEYSSTGRAESYKYGADWTPFEGLRLRGMFQQAVRAPNISDLFTPFTPGTGDLFVDPCAQQVLTSGSLFTLCAGTGVPVAVLNAGTLAQPTSGQVNNFISGNTDLNPEVAETFTAGFVWQPPQLGGLSVTVDYFNIEIADAISVRPARDIVDGCYNIARNTTVNPNAADCQRILRNTNGSLEGDTIYGVDQTTENIGDVRVEGIDYGISYTWDLGAWGELDTALDGTHLLTTSYVPSPGGAEIDCLGYYGKSCGLPETVNASVGGPVSQDRFVQRTTWSIADWELSYRWRYLSATEVTPEDLADSTTAGGLLDPNSLSIDSFNYIDLAATWEPMDFLRLTASITNATNEDAPFVFTTTGSTAYNSGNTYPSSYDVLGRVFTLGVRAKF
ncbi:MAG: TonB-dependent receptor [Hyphomonadaceae bacterium]|nr:TonB-dependent receptor [Hyphomonadaceae bacterium]